MPATGCTARDDPATACPEYASPVGCDGSAALRTNLKPIAATGCAWHSCCHDCLAVAAIAAPPEVLVMTQTREARKSAAPTTKTDGPDLSRAIAQSMERLAGEEIRCLRVQGGHYRCNWWVRDRGDGVASVTGRIVRSRFLRVNQTPDGLVIEDLTGER
jgi:hypothetical protein